MIGYCCCQAGCDCEGNPSVYRGFPSVAFHNYLNETSDDYIMKKNPYLGAQGQMNLDFEVKGSPNFTYYMEGKTQKLSISENQSETVSILASCHGDVGTRVLKIKENGSSEDISLIDGGGKGAGDGVGSGSASYKVGDGLVGNKLFTGFDESSFWRGSTSGMRYGFDGFRGSYGCCFYEGINYLIVAYGRNGVLIWQRQGTQQNFKYEFFAELNLSSTIATKVCTNGEYLYVGTCGYEKPQTSYENYFEQMSKQPEWKSGNSADLIEEVPEIGVVIYDIRAIIDEVLEHGSHNQGIVGQVYAGHVNDIKSGRDDHVYVASSAGMKKITRTEYIDAYGNKIVNFHSSNYSSETKVTAISILKGDKKTDEQVYYTVGTEVGYSVFLNGSGLVNAQNFSTRTLCTDPYKSCLQGGGWFGGGTPYDGYYIYRANVNNNTNFKRYKLGTCSGIGGEVQKSPEQIGNFANAIVVTENALYVSFWCNGFAKFTLGGGLLAHYSDFISTSCSSWKKYNPEKPKEFDVNTQHAISAGPIACAGSQVFVADSVQYVANGSGPLRYDPFRTSTNVQYFTRLIRGYRPEKGLFILE